MNNTSGSIRLFTSILLLLLYSCGSKKMVAEEINHGTNPTILGKWNATWEMNSEDVKDEKPEFKRMEGKINFIDSGNVEITTYGFDGCLFMTDTTINILNWRIEDKILRFIDKNDVQGIPYVVEEITDNKIRLSIMGDIHLTLVR